MTPQMLPKWSFWRQGGPKIDQNGAQKSSERDLGSKAVPGTKFWKHFWRQLAKNDAPRVDFGTPGKSQIAPKSHF